MAVGWCLHDKGGGRRSVMDEAVTRGRCWTKWSTRTRELDWVSGLSDTKRVDVDVKDKIVKKIYGYGRDIQFDVFDELLELKKTVEGALLI